MICDMQLPGMSGVDLFTLMRRHGRHVPTIFITAFEPERVRRLAGPDVIVFAKPFDSAELEKALQRILGG